MRRGIVIVMWLWRRRVMMSRVERAMRKKAVKRGDYGDGLWRALSLGVMALGRYLRGIRWWINKNDILMMDRELKDMG